jgi:hypothetical protein
MPLVRRKKVVGPTEEERAIEAMGGEYEAVSPIGLEAEVRQLGVRALRLVNASLLSSVAGLDQIEFLTVGFGLADPELITSFPSLRSLHVGDGWQGTLDFRRLPNLEWLSISDARYAAGLDESLAGHDKLRDLSVVFYGSTDLRSIGGLPALESLWLKQPRVRTLTGIEGAPRLIRLSLNYCASLNSLAGIETCVGLEYLALGDCRQITDIRPAAGLPRLRFLNVLGLTRLDSIRPLAGHPSLELLFLAQKISDGTAALGEIPHLKAVWGPPRNLTNLPTGVARFAEMPLGDPFVRDMRSLQAG